jgi:hypothetical protein
LALLLVLKNFGLKNRMRTIKYLHPFSAPTCIDAVDVGLGLKWAPRHQPRRTNKT